MIANFQIETQFPGGNAIVERIEGPNVWLRQDLRTTTEWWFYWHFHVRDAAGQTLRFHFTDGDVFTALGPCVCEDGQNWHWLGREIVQERNGIYSFEYSCLSDCVAFALSVPYVQSHLDDFLSRHPHIERDVLTQSEAGRNVELLKISAQNTRHSILISARSHACEAMANYVIEGLIEYSLNDEFLRQNVNLLVVPFLDKDGVESGDQGKLRAPHDHNRDFTDKPIYNSTRALMQMMQSLQMPIIAGIDIHCPWIRLGINEELATVGLPQPWQNRTDKFLQLIEENQRGTLRFRAANYTLHGVDWNQGEGFTFSRFMREHFPDALHAAFEIPYAVAGGQIMSADAAREFGQDAGRGLSLYLQQL